jgi:hypothetical protein
VKVFKVGRRPARHTLRTMRSAIVMHRHLAALGPPPTASQDYLTLLEHALGAVSQVGGSGPYGMYLNDQLGDCVCADTAHQVLLHTANSGTGFVVPTDDDVLALYEAVGGYVAGDPSTDRGCDETSMEEFLQHIGFCGQLSAGSGMIDPSNLDHVRWGIQLFGGVRLGIVVDEQMEQQFESNQPWVSPASPDDPNAGGHDVFAFAYDNAAGIFRVFTWGGIASVSAALMANSAFLDEVHGSVWPDFIAATGSAPNGFDLQQLLSDLPAVA